MPYFDDKLALGNIPESYVDKNPEAQATLELIEQILPNTVNVTAAMIDKILSELEGFNTWTELEDLKREFKISELFEGQENFYSVSRTELLKGFFQFKGTYVDIQYLMKTAGYELTISEKGDGTALGETLNDCELASEVTIDLDSVNYHGFDNAVIKGIRNLLEFRLYLCTYLVKLSVKLKATDYYSYPINDEQFFKFSKKYEDEYFDCNIGICLFDSSNEFYDSGQCQFDSARFSFDYVRPDTGTLYNIDSITIPRFDSKCVDSRDDDFFKVKKNYKDVAAVYFDDGEHLDAEMFFDNSVIPAERIVLKESRPYYDDYTFEYSSVVSVHKLLIEKDYPALPMDNQYQYDDNSFLFDNVVMPDDEQHIYMTRHFNLLFDNNSLVYGEQGFIDPVYNRVVAVNFDTQDTATYTYGEV